MTKKDSLGDRMKRYESVTKTHLVGRMPVIIRLDGKAFHTFAPRFNKLLPRFVPDTPFNTALHTAMVDATTALVKTTQTAVVAYTQSDEISILLRNYDTVATQAWFDNAVQKIVSITASEATGAFKDSMLCQLIDVGHTITPELVNTYKPRFDSRVYNLPESEVVNYFIWRQQDASRNSVQMLGHHHFSQKRMTGLKNPQVQELLFAEKGINWNDIPTWAKRGTCVTTTVVDREIPMFTADRDYIGQHLIPPILQETA